MPEDQLPEFLQVGLWLGSANRISSMVRLRKGWKAVDTTGASYYQAGSPSGRNFPDGLQASFINRPGSIDNPRIPWPSTTGDKETQP